MKRLLALVLTLTVCLSFAGCGEGLEQLGQQLGEMGQLMGDAMDGVQNPDQEKTFTNNGATLTLNTSFLDFTKTEKNAGEYAFLYANDSIGILAIEENKQDLFAEFSEMDVQGYADLIAQLYTLGVTAEQKDGFWTYTYETTTDDVSQTFLCVFHETETAFWNIQSYCETELYAENQEAMWKYLTSATFSAG